MRLTYNTRLVLFSIVLLLVALVIATIGTYLYMLKTNTDITKDYEQRILHQVSMKIDSTLKEIDLHSYGILTNLDLKRHLTLVGTENEDITILSKAKVEEILVTHMFSRRDIASIELYDLSGGLYTTQGINVHGQEFFPQVLAQASEAKGRLVYLKQEEVGIVSVARTISSLDLKPVGVLVINLRSSLFQDVLKAGKVSSMGDIMLLDGSNTVIASTLEGWTGRQLGTNPLLDFKQQYNTSFIKGQLASTYEDWSYITILSEHAVRDRIIGIREFFIAWGIVLALLFSILLFFLLKRLSTPIRDMTHYVRTVEIEGWKPEAVKTDNDDIQYLNSAVNAMLEQIKDLIDKNYKAQIMREKQRFEQLQAQVNPHFLYNTLDLMKWTARSKGLTDIGVIAKSLSEILRYSLDNTSEEVDVEEELEFTRKYLKIQEYRYGEQLEVSIEMDKRLLGQGIIRLTLQPIVENAFRHGFAYINDVYRLQITGVIEDDMMVISVQDNGRGMSAENLAQLQEHLGASTCGGHLGLANVSERIRIHYGDRYGLWIRGAEERGVVVSIKLPLS